MLLLILGEHELQRWNELQEKTMDVFKRTASGVQVLRHYATLSGNLTFTLIETDEEEKVEQLMAELSGLSTYRAYPIYEVGKGEKMGMGEGYCDPMHGPV